MPKVLIGALASLYGTVARGMDICAAGKTIGRDVLPRPANGIGAFMSESTFGKRLTGSFGGTTWNSISAMRELAVTEQKGGGNTTTHMRVIDCLT